MNYVQAVCGEGSTVKRDLPFVCPDVDFIERMIGSSEAIVLLAKDKNTIVGAVGGWLKGTPSGYEVEDECLRQHDAYDEAHLCWIAVNERRRDEGIGSSLVARVSAWAKTKGKNKIWAEVQRETTDFDTVVFYRKLGFKEIGSFQDEMGEKYVTMVKQL